MMPYVSMMLDVPAAKHGQQKSIDIGTPAAAVGVLKEVYMPSAMLDVTLPSLYCPTLYQPSAK